MYTSGLVVARRDASVCQVISEALAAAGLTVQRLVTRIERAEAIIARADAEGGVPIVVTWDARGDGARLIAELLACDTLPARPYVLVATNDVTGAVIAEELDAKVGQAAERILMVTLSDLALATTRELLTMHLSRTCASYLGRTPRARGISPAPVTEMPVGERNINNIERRAMQRGMFRVPVLRTPRF